MSIRRFLTTAVLLLPLLAVAQTRFLADPVEARKVTEEIVASVAAGNFAGAVKELRPLSVIAATNFDVFEAQVNSQQANLLRMFGPAHGYEFLTDDRLGSHIVRFQYMVFHEKAAMRWNFVVYKTERGWVISHFNFESNALSFF